MKLIKKIKITTILNYLCMYIYCNGGSYWDQDDGKRISPREGEWDEDALSCKSDGGAPVCWG